MIVNEYSQATVRVNQFTGNRTVSNAPQYPAHVNKLEENDDLKKWCDSLPVSIKKEIKKVRGIL
jgi:hypothetical protein